MSTELEQTPLVPAAAVPVGVPIPPRRRAVGPRRGFGSKLSAYVVVLLISIVSLFPLYWMLENSLRTAVDAGANVTLVPKFPWQWSNYSAMWNYLPYPMSTFLINSFLVAGLVTVGTVISSALIAYGFARFRFPGRNVFFAVIISTMMIPYAVMMIPQYALFINFFHWGSGGSLFGYHNLKQFLPQIVPAFFGSPIFIFLLRQFIRGIPYTLDEAAMVDGAGPLRIFWKIILPELQPALAAVVVLTFIGKWNDFPRAVDLPSGSTQLDRRAGTQRFRRPLRYVESQPADGGFRDRHRTHRDHLLRRLATDHRGRHSERRQGLSLIGKSHVTVSLRRSGPRCADRRAFRHTDSTQAGRLLDGGGLLLRFPRCRKPPSSSANGDVLMTGGEDVKDGRPTAVVQRYHTATGRWSTTAAMRQERIGHTVSLLDDGRVLVVGGSGEEAAAAALGRDLRPGARPLGCDRAATAGSVLAHRHASSRRPRARGGRDRPRPDLPQCTHLRSAQAGLASGAVDARSACAAGRARAFRRARSDRWRVRRQSRAVRPEKRQVDEGGRSSTYSLIRSLPRCVTAMRCSPRVSTTRDRLSPRPASSIRRRTAGARPRRWPSGGTAPSVRSCATAGSWSPAERPSRQVLRSAEIYDVRSNRWTSAAPMHQARSAAAALLLRNGNVLVCGGSWYGTVLNSCELYHP